VSQPYGIPADELAEDDLLRELRHLHETRHDTFLHGSVDALGMHTRRTLELEVEYVRRHPEREIDPARLRPTAPERANRQ
jgi:hypothetical protein